MDDKTIQNFLILNKCSIEKTKPKLDMYYTIRSQLSNIFENINPKLPNLKKTMEIIYYVPLPKLTKEMYRVFAFKVRDKTMIDELDISDVIRLLINLAEVRMKEDVAFGDVVIIDAKDFSLKFLMQLTPTVLYKLLVTLYEKVLSARLKAVYIINTYPFMTKFLAIVKAVMKPKLFERLHMCQDPNILQEKFDIAMLPGDFGGNEKSLEELQSKILHLEKSGLLK
ncbi:CRAL TRIO domain containing protein, partial [Asbolus verrucosus]